MKLYRDTVKRVMDFLFAVSALLLGVSTLMTFLNAVLRRGFSFSFVWSEEFCTYCIVIGVFLALPFLEVHDNQLSIGLLNSIIKNKKVLKGIFLLRGAVIIVVSYIVGIYGVAAAQAAVQAHTETYVLRWPKSILYFIAVAGFWMAIVAWITIFLNKGDKVE